MRFLKHTQRILKREKLFSLINLLGLSIGMFCFLVAALYVNDEVSYDRWHQNADNIYMSNLKMSREDGQPFDVNPSDELLKALKEESPGVVSAATISGYNWANYQNKDEWIETNALVYSTPEIFEVFDFSLKYGDQTSVLTSPLDIILSAEIAESLFPAINPIGETIKFKYIGDFKVVGVLNPIPKNSHLKFDFIGSTLNRNSIYNSFEEDWLVGRGYSYFSIRKDYSPENLLADAKVILARNGITKEANGLTFDRFSELYLNGKTRRYDAESLFGGQKEYLYIFSLVGGLILFVACFNYINLTTARSFSRVKQMGIRKIMGASRNRLVFSQMEETFYLSFIALMIALIGLELLLPFAKPLIGKELEMNFSEAPQLMFLPISLLILVVVISGIYPALSLGSINISAILRGNLPQSKLSILRKSLFVLQFTICSGLLIAALIIRGQANYLIEMDKGFNEEGVFSMSLYQDDQELDYQTLKNALITIPQIQMVTSSPLPQFPPSGPMVIEIDGKSIPMTINSGAADIDFNAMFELEFLEGDDFSKIDKSELENAAIINETAKNKLGLKPAIGSKMPDGKTVIGVVKDFHYMSTKDEIQPAVIFYDPNSFYSIQFKISMGNKGSVEEQVKAKLKDFGVLSDPNIKAIKGYFDFAYKREAQLVTIFDLLTLMVVIVAFLGLFALSSFENKLREKEMGIRKVLGATYLNLIQTLNKRFTWLIVLAIAIAVPITKYSVEQWLSDFPYRPDSLNIYFISAIAIVGFIAFSVLGLHSYFSAQKNPVDVLRSE